MVRVAALNEIRYLIVDTVPPDALSEAIEKAGVKIIITEDISEWRAPLIWVRDKSDLD